MGDVIQSEQHNAVELMTSFKSRIAALNERHSASILSPLTITLGDEFQGVVADLSTAVALIIECEEYALFSEDAYSMRYVVNYGEIETAVNPTIAYEMLGQGLTQARYRLEGMKNRSERFAVITGNQVFDQMMKNAWHLFQSIYDGWNLEKDRRIIADFVCFDDYKIVADRNQKTRSQIWKREKTLRISDYRAIKELIHSLANEHQ